jgi:hypothetical protein
VLVPIVAVLVLFAVVEEVEEDEDIAAFFDLQLATLATEIATVKINRIDFIIVYIGF